MSNEIRNSEADDLQRIQNVCKFYGEKLRMDEKSYRSQFMVDASHQVAFCRHGKVCMLKSFFVISLATRTFFYMLQSTF